MADLGDFAPWTGVFETVRVHNGLPLFLSEHRAELKRAAQALGLKPHLSLEAERAKLSAPSGRWRWIVTANESRTLFTAEEPPSTAPVALSVSPVRVGSHNWDARFKTFSYLSHAQAWQTASTPEVVMLNEHGHVAGASRANIFWRREDRYFTPAHEAGCRRGVVRGFVLKSVPVEEGHFPLSDLYDAREIFLTNSMMGIVSVWKVDDQKVPSQASAGFLRTAYEQVIEKQLRGGRLSFDTGRVTL